MKFFFVTSFPSQRSQDLERSVDLFSHFFNSRHFHAKLLFLLCILIGFLMENFMVEKNKNMIPVTTETSWLNVRYEMKRG
jgi:hypothetical protein